MAEKRKGKRRKEVNSSSLYVNVVFVYDFVSSSSYLHARRWFVCIFLLSKGAVFISSPCGL
jgi:hypothetical protein